MEDKYNSLESSHKLRIRRVVLISALWAGYLIVSAGVFVACKPYLARKREERLKQPGYTPLVTPKHGGRSSN